MKVIVINVFAFICVLIVIYKLIFENEKGIYIFKKKIKVFSLKLKENKVFKDIETIIVNLEDQKKINKKRIIITPIIILLLSVITFVSSYTLLYTIFKVKSTALILAVPGVYLPQFFLKYILDRQKSRMLDNLPTYILNLKNKVSSSQDIISAIKTTRVEEPLSIYINRFNLKVDRGVNIVESFENLKEDIGIKKVYSFISACQICYINGGNFTAILNRFSEIITKDNIQREKLKESSYTSIITLFVMFLMNLYLMFAFVFKNVEYANIIRKTFGGVVILNFTAITYIVIMYLILKIYRIGDV